MKIENFQINKPIIIGELENLILNVAGVVNLLSINITNKSGIQNGNGYSPFSHDIKQNIDRGFLFPPNGGIFELKYPSEDVKGTVI